ncbi:hypothetical protein F2P47_04350 [Parvibaculum sedimenti]|uniref:Uncharacterized protein n=1 Tax=Parvibaculum sedimenti TaxID=2608632 RepID=A0A6N6VP14_9HYPH|nr:hypothetical protein [Parvibaculum sedimenti]KAB7741640.1 hypothetical protein F2P47_04350 [Parvibaculum sedimenti]
MRIILGLIIVLLIAAIGTPLVRYGTLDPCRILAKDLARESYSKVAKAMGVEPGETPEAAESLARAMTSQYSEGECVSRLKDRWFGVEKPAE